MKSIQNNQKGFTWRELAVFLGASGVLALIAVGLILHSERVNRDMKRLSDVKLMQNALELYFHDCNHYPVSVKANGKISSAEDCGGNVYLQSVPLDPRGLIYEYVPCSGNGPYECKRGTADATSYQLYYTLEGQSDIIPPGKHIATPQSIATQ